MDYTKHFATRLRRLITPQSEKIPGTDQVRNSGGGYAFELDPWARLDRFLILGSEGGTYYIRERELTIDNATTVAELIDEDGERVVQRAVEISVSGRAPKNDPALFVLAMAAGLGDETTRAAALAALPKVARTATHLFHWLQFVQGFRGWGRSVRRAVAAWYTEKDAGKVAYQVLKYPSRDGWAHRDALRLAHAKPPTPTHDLIFRYAVKGWEAVVETEGIDPEVAATLEAVRSLADATPAEAAKTISEHRLVREMVPTELLRHAVVWEALLERMPMTAMIRNLGVMTKVGLLTPMADAAETVATRLGDGDALQAARVHPLAVLAALKTYASGRGMRGRGAWDPVARVVDALDAAFYLAFRNAPSTGQRTMLALDVSGSMNTGVAGMPYLSCREASAAMALVTAATEPKHMFTAFTAGGYTFRGWSTGLRGIAISPRQRLDDVVRATGALPFGGTDCALPMVEALKNGWEIDVFVVYTDSETWAGNIHPVQALREYRERMGIAAKLVVVGMASNGFSIADPDDAGMLDVVGFDTATPGLIADFAS
ncbi:MAG: TROVE domain-containing protein [Gemmatimonadota bacterium]